MFSKILYILLISMVPIMALRGAIPVGTAMGVPWYYCMLAAIIGNMIPAPFILLFIEKIFAFMKKRGMFPKLINWLETKAQKGAQKISNSAQKRIEKNTEITDKSGAELQLDTAKEQQEIICDINQQSQETASELDTAKEQDENMCNCEQQSQEKANSECSEKAKQVTHKISGIGAYVALSVFVAVPLPGTGAWTGSLVAGLFRMNRKKAFLSIFTGVIVAAVIVTLISYGILGFLNFLI